MEPLIRLRRLMSRARIWGIALLFGLSLSASDVKAAIPGDVGGGAGIDISDALWTLRYVVGLIPAGTTGYLSADVSPLDSVTRLPKGGDGITIADALAILRRVVNLDSWYSPASCLNGTAAAGAPIIGSVTIKDSSSPAATRTVPIAADGKYTVDVNGMTAPYMIRADGYVGGNEYHLYSAGTSADMGGTINVTPLTDLIVANIAKTVADDYFNSGNFSGLTAEQLTAQSDALKDKLLPVLQAVGVSDSIDLLRASFSTDHTSLDAALDVLRVTTDTNTGVATITNIINQQQMTSDVTTGTYTGVLDGTGVLQGVTDIQAISAGFKKFSELFANGLPSESSPTLVGLFDEATFMQEGMNLTAFLSERTTDPGMVGILFDNISIQSMDTANGTAVVAFDVIQHGRVMNDGPRPFHMIKRNGVWYMQGDQRIAQVEVEPEAEYRVFASGTQIATGLRLDIEDRGGRGITSALVTGAGLPVGGVTLINNVADEDFQIEGQQFGNLYSMEDPAIASIADSGEIYTVELYTNGVLSASYTEKLKKRPYLSSELSTASFPGISQQTLTQMQSFTGGNATVNWTLPAGLTNDWLSVGLGDNNGNTAEFEAGLLPAETSKSFTLNPVTTSGPFTPTYGWLWLGAWDSFGRQLATSVSGSSSTGSNPPPVQNDAYVWIEGNVYASSGHNGPIAGAVVSTSIASETATTDASGHFFLQTTTPTNYSTTPYTITVTKPGYTTFNQTWNWGDHPAGQTFNLDGTFGI